MSQCVCEAFSELPQSYEAMRGRCAQASRINATLDSIEVDSENWIEVLQCRQCRRYWVAERPFSESHGGGPACYYSVPALPEIGELEPLMSRLRSHHDDAEFLALLGSEVGPNRCAKSECTRLAVKQSVLCAGHHFAQVKGRAPYSE
jgi:hypothetical protein